MPDPPAEPDDAPQQAVTRPDHHGSGVDHSEHEAKPKKRRKLLRIVLVLVVLVAVLIALTPTLLSTGPGTRWLVSFIGNQTPGELTVDDLSLSWLGGQRVDGVAYDDPAQGLRIEIESIDARDLGLLSLLRGNRRFGEVWLTETEVVYTASDSADDQVPDPAANDSKQPREPIKVSAGFSGTLVFDQLTVKYVAQDIEPIVLTSSQDSIQVNDIRDISISFNSKIRQGTKTGRLELIGSVLNLFDPDGFEQAAEASYNFNFALEGVSTSAVDQVVSGLTGKIEPGRLHKLLGEGDLFTLATVNGTIDQLKSDLTIQTPKLEVQLHQIAQNGKLIASPDSYAELDLDQDGFEALFPDSGLTLQKPTQVNLESLEMALPIVNKAVDWETATAMMLLKAGDDLAVVDERGEVLGINDLRIVGHSESIADKIVFKLTTELTAVDQSGQHTRDAVALDLDVIKPFDSTRQIEFFSEKLPITLVDALIGKGWQLPLWLGDTLALDADLRGELMADERVTQKFAVRPEGRVTGTISGSFSKGSYRFATPKDAPIEAELSPEAFASLMEMLSGREGEPALTIDKAMPVYVTLRDPDRGPISITTRQDKTGLKGFYLDPDQTTLSATIELSPARVFDPKLKKTYELRGGSLTIHAPDLRGKTNIRAALDLWVRPDAGKEGVASLLTWDTTVTDLLDSEGSLPLDGELLMQQLAATGQMQLENVPSGLMDTLLNRQGDLASILGPIVQSMDAGFTYQDGQPTGASVRLNWDEKNNQPMPGAWASMKPAALDIDDQQMLTVRGGEDLEIQVRVSEEFGDRWMGKLHPILFDAKSGDRPVKIKIDGKSFRFPLKGEKMVGSRVEASVDLGTIQFGDDALLGKLMQWADRPGERAVFEPAIVKLIDGKISYDQFDLAVGKVKLRLDGEVDLASGQIVDMAVRVPGDSLIRVFNELDGVIKPDDFLSIPMSGAIRKPEFDSKLIGREVARLVTRGLLDKQKDKLKDLIRDGIGGGDDKPKPEPKDNADQPDGEPGEPAEDPAPDPAQDVADELIERGLDLLFKRLGKDKKEPEQE